MKMKRSKGKGLIFLGLLLLVAALSLTVYNLYDSQHAAQSADQAVRQLEALIPTSPRSTPPQSLRSHAPPFNIAESAQEAPPEPEETETPTVLDEVEIPDYILNPEMEMPVLEIDGVDYIGILTIPALGLELPVASRWSYAKLKLAPCRYEGSAYLDSLVIAAHNYPSHFRNLKQLILGDTVVFTDVDGNVFQYEVAAMETLAPTNVEEMVFSGWDLTLFTCTIGGQSRIAVRCQRLDTENTYG